MKFKHKKLINEAILKAYQKQNLNQSNLVKDFKRRLELFNYKLIDKTYLDNISFVQTYDRQFNMAIGIELKITFVQVDELNSQIDSIIGQTFFKKHNFWDEGEDKVYLSKVVHSHIISVQQLSEIEHELVDQIKEISKFMFK